MYGCALRVVDYGDGVIGIHVLSNGGDIGHEAEPVGRAVQSS